MTLFTLDRTLVAADMAINAQTMHDLISIVPEVAHGTALFTGIVALFMMAIDTLPANFFRVCLVRHFHRADLASEYRFVGIGTQTLGGLGDSDHIGLGFTGSPGIVGAGNHETNYNGAGNEQGRDLVLSHCYLHELHQKL